MEPALPIYAALLCNQVGLKFTMGGNTAWSAGGQINLPALPYNDKKTKWMAYGMIMHEGGHEAHTDYQAWDTIKHLNAIAAMTNRLEDIRIEKKQIDRFPGAKSRLQQMVEGLCEIGYFTGPKEDSSPSTLLGMAILYRLRANVLSQTQVSEWGDEALARLEKAIPAHVAQHLMTIAEQVVWCQNTAEVVDLAANILDLLKEEQEKLEEEQKQEAASQQQQQQAQGSQDPSQAQGQGQDEDDSQESDGQGEDPSQSDPSQQPGSQANEQEDDQSQSTGQGSDPNANQQGEDDSQSQGGDAGDSDDQAATGQAAGDGGEQPANEDDSLAKAMAKAISSILSNEDDSAPGDVGEALAKALSDISDSEPATSIAMPQAQVATLENGDAHQILARVQNASRALQTRAYRLFEATAKKKRTFREQGRRIDVSRVWRAKTGDFRVFVEKAEAPKVNTAVQILLDISYSMFMMDRIQPAIDAALALAMALHKLNGVKVATATFPAVGARSNSTLDNMVSVLHTFDQRPEQVAKKFGGIEAYSDTPTAEALLWSAGVLLNRKEARKVLFVITDGEPDVANRPTRQYERLTIDVRESLEEAGIEVVGIGIQCNVQKILPNSVTVNGIDDLARSVFEAMSKTLFKQAA